MFLHAEANSNTNIIVDSTNTDINDVMKIFSKQAEANLNINIIVDFTNTDIDDVMKIFSEKMNINIVKNKNVETKINARLKDVPALEALNIICKTHGLSYTIRDNLITICNGKDFVSEGLIYEGKTRVYKLTYTKATEIYKKLQSVVGSAIIEGRLNIYPDERVNAIIAIIRKDRIEELALAEIINAFDQPTLQVLVEAKIIEVALSEENKYGIKWDSLSKLKFVMPFSGNEEKDMSLSRTFLLPGKNGSIDGLITAIGSKSDAKVLSNPRLVINNNEEAKIIVGRNEPYTQTIKDPLGGSLSTTEFVETGIGFTVMPQINENYVTLQIAPIVSSAAPRENLFVPPVISKSEAKTVVTTANNSTIMIGGLISEKKSTVITRVPLLGRIPILGYLFSSRNYVTLRSELVLILTVKIVKP